MADRLSAKAAQTKSQQRGGVITAKYKCSLDRKIKDFVEWQLEHYQENKRQLQEYRRDMIPSPTPAYSLAGGSSEVGRKTESVTFCIMTDRYITETERTTNAIGYVLDRLSEIDLRLIDLIYWKGAYTAEGAGLKVGLSKSATYRHINDIITAIALELGYVSI